MTENWKDWVLKVSELQDKAKVMIVCDVEDRKGIPGQWVECNECLRKIFLSDTGLQSLHENGLTHFEVECYCMECAEPKMKHAKESVEINREKLKEIELITSRKGKKN